MVHAMPENLDPGRGPARQVLYAQGEQRQERNPRWQFDRRAEQHLGSTFHSVGDIRNFVSRLDPTYNVNKVDTNLDNSKNQAGNTRVMVWNAGGGAGTLQDPDKLGFLCQTMMQQNIHVACLLEGGVSRETLWAGVKLLNMQQQFRVFGENGTVMWLVQTETAEKVQKNSGP